MTPRNPKASITLLALLVLSLLLQLKGAVVLALPRVERIVLPNQLVLLVAEEHSLPLVTLQLLIDSGSRRDPPGKEGLANLTAKGVLLGTSAYSVTAFREALDFMGASLNSWADRDKATLVLRVLKKDLNKGFDLFMEALTQPTFPQGEIERQLEKTLAAIQSSEDRPGKIARKAFRGTLFSKNPYGHPVEGTRESLPRITREAVLQFYNTYYHPNIAILALVGDITSEEVREKLIPRLLQWRMGKIPDEHFTATFTKGAREIKVSRNISQANIILGHKGISRKAPDYYAAIVMNYILGGGGFGSRLFEEIRVKRGLAYSVTSYFVPRKYPGSFQISLQTKNASAREAISLVRRELERIQREPVSEEEVGRAKKYLIGSFPLRLDTQTKLARFITEVEYYDLGLDYCEKYPLYINAVTREDVLRVAKSYLHPENAILVVVANLEEAGMR
jgi:zinc protease